MLGILRYNLSCLFYIAKDNYIKRRISVNVMDIESTIDHICNTGCCVSRFGDGEFALMREDTALAAELRDVAKNSSSISRERCLVCIPGFWANERWYTASIKQFWQKQLPYNHTRARYYGFCDQEYLYGNADITRCYLGIRDKKAVGSYFDKWMNVWRGEDVILVEGRLSRFGIGTDLLSSAESVRRILCPAVDAYNRITEIEKCIEQHASEGNLILIALGCTATILCYRLASKNYRAIDIGNIDKEYEWFIEGATEKKRNPIKYSPEVEGGTDVEDFDDEDYLMQVIAEVF